MRNRLSSPRRGGIAMAVGLLCGSLATSLALPGIPAAASTPVAAERTNPPPSRAAAGYPYSGGGSAGNVGASSASPAVHAAATSSAPGYWEVASDGGVYAYGAAYLGQMRGTHLNSPVVGAAARPDGKGYWLLASDGGIFSFGNAAFHGSMGGRHLNKPMVGLASTATGSGYWSVASDGGIFAFGDAAFHGSMGGRHLNRPIVAMASTGDGKGYWLVASDGGIFAFGDAAFHGSMGGHHLNQPIVGMAATPDGNGYWLVARDGGIFAFGDAAFHGSMGGAHLNQPIAAMAASPSGHGYWMMARDGGVFAFGDAKFLGSTGSAPGPAPIVAAVSTAHGYPTGLAATGYDISWPQCSGSGTVALPPSTGLAVVGATDGTIAPTANPCLDAEARWAGSGMQTYIVADPVAQGYGPLSAATAGPKACAKAAYNAACSYNWGWNNARASVAMVHARGLSPAVWWIDVETTGEPWNTSLRAVNAQVIQGMVDGLRSEGVTAGIYCTNYQWGVITGGYRIPGIPVWIAGAGNVTTGTYSAANFCALSADDFAGGSPWMVQYGYTGSGYTGPAATSGIDRDYACPR